MRQSAQQRRLMQEVKHLAANPSPEYHAAPMENDMHTWHFTLRGPPSTEFEHGIYHGRIAFPFDYPLSPPDIYFLNKSGRFEVNQKICLTITGFHSDQWNASWTVRSMLEGIISMFPEKEKVQSVGSLNQTTEYRKRIAKESWDYTCDKCGVMSKILQPRTQQETNSSTVDTHDSKATVVNSEVAEESKANEQITEATTSAADVNLLESLAAAAAPTAEETAQQIEEEQKHLEAIRQSLKQYVEANRIASEQHSLFFPSANNNHLEQQHQQHQRDVQAESLNKQSGVSYQSVLVNLEEMMNVIFSIRTEEPVVVNKKPANQQPVQQRPPAAAAATQDTTKAQAEAHRAKEGILDTEDQSIFEELKESNDDDKPLINDVPSIPANVVDEDKQIEEPTQKEEPTNSTQNQVSDQETDNDAQEEEEFNRRLQRAEALRQVKRIDLFIFLTAFCFLLYLTLSFQISF